MQETQETGSITELKRSHGGGNGNPLQYSCLGNPMDRGTWWAYSPWGCKELDMIEHVFIRARARTHTHTHTHTVKEALGQFSI